MLVQLATISYQSNVQPRLVDIRSIEPALGCSDNDLLQAEWGLAPMTQNQVATGFFGRVDTFIVIQNVLRARTPAIRSVASSVAASDFHLQHSRYHLPILTVVEASKFLAVIIRVQLPTLHPSLAITARLAGWWHEG